MKKIFSLVDCNNFYVSCERVFNPKLRNQPVMVLSNNDGCVVARSNEVKKMGVRMGAPVFECRALIKKHRVEVFSSNYTLYADMSERVMHTLSRLCADMEIYSIDEAFLLLEDRGRERLTAHAQKIRKMVYQWTGIPVSVGIGTTKTLAKIANKMAKRDPANDGVFNLVRHNRLDAVLSSLEVGDIWGIGPKHAHFLYRHRIRTVKELCDLPDEWLKKQLRLPGLRTALELRGVVCYPLEKNRAPKKNTATTRSFGQPVTQLRELEEAVASFATRVAEKIRWDGQSAGSVLVFLGTNRFKKEPQYFNSHFTKFKTPTGYTPDIIAQTMTGLHKIFRAGYNYKKAGVILGGLVPADRYQKDFFGETALVEKKRAVMEALDAINTRFGSDTLQYATAGFKKNWQMRQARRSAPFSTSWNQTLKVS
jgi:DNA polymerase V